MKVRTVTRGMRRTKRESRPEENAVMEEKSWYDFPGVEAPDTLPGLRRWVMACLGSDQKESDDQTTHPVQ